MRAYIEQLIALVDQCNENTIGRLVPDMTADEVVTSMQTASASLRGIMSSIQDLLHGQLDPMLEPMARLTQGDEQDLHTLAQKLSAYTHRLDPGLALKIYQALLARARTNGDDYAVLKYLYWCGITTYYLSNAMHAQCLAYFEEGAAFKNRYREITDLETRKYVHRCLGNVSMILHQRKEHVRAFEVEESTFAFWNGLLFEGMDASLPWQSYFLSVLHHRRVYAAEKLHSEPQTCTKEEARRYLQLAKTIHRLYHQNTAAGKAFGGSRYDFTLWEAQYVAGLIGYDQLYENVEERKRTFDPDDYATDALYVHIQLNSFLLFYARKMLPLGERRQRLTDALARDSAAYFAKIPMNADPETVASLMKIHASNAGALYDSHEHLDMVLRMTSYRHIPTYAHSLMVSRIACILTQALAQVQPEVFVGMCGIDSAAETAQKRKELLDFARMAGRCHDIGKIEFIYNPAILRRLPTDQEWDLIKTHTTAGAKLLDEAATSPEMAGFAAVIEGHHRHFDGQGGYPETFDIVHSPFRVMIAVMAVADTIDAATDNIGKVYAAGIPLDEVCAQIKAQSGTRYAPYVADLLEQPGVRKALVAALQVDRKAAYYQAYLHSWNRAEAASFEEEGGEAHA